MKAFECTGRWWLPEDEPHGVAGTLKVSQSGDLRLHLVGSLGPPPSPRMKKHSVILGWVEENSRGDKVTLANCMLGGSIFGSHEPTRENYNALRAFFGRHLVKREDFIFNSMSLRLAGLSEWAHDHTGFGKEQFTAGVGERVTLLTYAIVSPLDADVPGGRLSLGVGMRSSGSHRNRQFQEEVGLNVYTETARSTDDLNSDFVYPLQNLMTFVCDRSQEVEDFAVRSGEFPRNLMGGDIHIVGSRVQPEEDADAQESVHHFQMLFTLADVNFAEFMGNWLRVTQRFASACNVFFGVQYGAPAFIDMAFPYVVQALYLYHSQRGGDGGRDEEAGRMKKILAGLSPADADWMVDRLGTRPFPPLQLVLRKLVEEHDHVMNPLVSHRQERFVSEVANTMKYMMFREAEIAQAASGGADLYWMMQKLRFLFKSCLMYELGFPKEKVKSLFERNGLYQHVCRLEEAEERERQKA